MCGIAGYVGPRPLDEARVEQTLGLMRRRGPDHASHHRFSTPDGRTVELLHSRLTIIDLDPRANQPFGVDGRWMTFNGELYNYVELRERLAAEGATFSTESDTEVLLRVIVDKGWGSLDDCEGMWAFAVYDERDGTLALCRDRFGEKPLYLLRDGHGGLLFGSEAKFLFSLLGRTPPVNSRHLRRYLVYGYKSLYKRPDTFFEGLHELAPHTVLRIGSDGERSMRYWCPGVPEDNEGMTFDDAVKGARERLLRAVGLRLRADVPLAFCMSGGVDSLSLIATASRIFGHDVHGFTIMNQDERYEEREMVALAVEALDVKHTSVELDTSNFLPRLRTLVRQHDAPVYTISHFVQWLLMESIHQHGYRVAISGTAADELFSGYYDHHLWYLREIRDRPELHAVSRQAWMRHVRPIVRNPYLSDPDRFVDEPGFRGHIFLGAERFGSYLQEPFSEPFVETKYGPDLLRTRMLNELFAEAVPVILHEEDLNAMYFSIENRSPFLDRDLFEFCLTIPTPHLIRDARAKAVLREAMRGIAPDAVLDNRRKVGFNAPIQALLDTRSPAVRAELLGDSPVWDYVRRDPVKALLDRDGLPNSESKFLFNVLCSKLFLEEVAA